MIRFQRFAIALAPIAGFIIGASCVGVGGAPFDPADIVSLAGAYDYTFSLQTLVDAVNNPTREVSCTGTGSIDIDHEQGAQQFTGTLTGSVSCDGPDGPLDVEHTSPITDSGANPNGFTFGFTFPLFESVCTVHEGTASGEPVDELSSDMTCVLNVSGEEIIVVGAWQAKQ